MRFGYAALLVLSGLTELFAAATLIGGPEGLAAAGEGQLWSMHYGFAALAIASCSAWAWPLRQDLAAVTVVLGILSVFHFGLAVSLAVAGDQPQGMIIHGVLAMLSLVLVTSRDKIVGES